jgi:hypothetical protein
MQSTPYTPNYWQRRETNKSQNMNFVHMLYTIFSYNYHDNQQLFHYTIWTE